MNGSRVLGIAEITAKRPANSMEARRTGLKLKVCPTTTMDPAARTMIKVNLEDAAKADEIFSILMGDKVEPRREFIEQNARYAKDLDI